MPRIPAGTDEGGGDSNYADAAPAMTAPDGAEEAGEESPRGLIPKSLLMGKEFKPGDKIILKIEAIHGDEVEVSYPEEGADEPAADKAAAPPAGGGEMAPMME